MWGSTISLRAVLEQIAQLSWEHLGPTNEQTALSFHNLITKCLDLGDIDKASEICLRDSPLLKARNPSHYSIFGSNALLGHTWTLQMKFDEAESWLERGYQGLKTDSAPTGGELIDYQRTTIEYLIELYQVWDKPDKVEVWKTTRDNLLSQDSFP